MVQRRLGLPLLAAAAASGARLSRHGKAFDCYGDVAQNDGEEGHQTRHFQVLNVLVSVLRSVWGGQVQREPADYEGYSDTRPDLTVNRDGLLVGDLKMFDAIGSDGVPPMRATMVGFGNTHPKARELCLGLRERGQPGDGEWNWRKGSGHVAARDGKYARALRAGCRVVPLLVETLGGMGPELTALLRELADERQNRLTAGEYDDTTWSARTWLAFSTQRLSVAIHRAAALEIGRALGLSTFEDPRE